MTTQLGRLGDELTLCNVSVANLGIASLLRELDERGVRCPVGIEALRREIVADGAGAAAGRLIAALRAVIAAARGDAVVRSLS